MALDLIRRSWIYFELLVVYDVRWECNLISFGDPIVLAHLLKRLFFPPLNGLSTLMKNQLTISQFNRLTIDIWMYFWTFSSIPLVYMSILMSEAHYFNYYSFVISFGMGKYEFTNIIIFQDCFGYSGPLQIHMNLRNNFLFPARKAIMKLIGYWICTSLLCIDFLTILSFPIHEHRMYFYLFRSSLITFSS